jgi:CubicO group peptidase (beta-lactamase class C family)
VACAGRAIGRRATRAGEIAPHFFPVASSSGSAAPDSIFEIGSITKPFTALALARMAEEGKVRLDLPLRALVLTARLPQPIGSEITLLDLATHHSGLPPLPWNLRPRDMANHARLSDRRSFAVP